MYRVNPKHRGLKTGQDFAEKYGITIKQLLGFMNEEKKKAQSILPTRPHMNGGVVSGGEYPKSSPGYDKLRDFQLG